MYDLPAERNVIVERQSQKDSISRRLLPYNEGDSGEGTLKNGIAYLWRCLGRNIGPSIGQGGKESTTPFAEMMKKQTRLPAKKSRGGCGWSAIGSNLEASKFEVANKTCMKTEATVGATGCERCTAYVLKQDDELFSVRLPSSSTTCTAPRPVKFFP